MKPNTIFLKPFAICLVGLVVIAITFNVSAAGTHAHIARGHHTILPGRTLALPARLYPDPGRPAPTRGLAQVRVRRAVSFSSVYPSSATVTVRDRTLSLQHAIDTKIVALKWIMALKERNAPDGGMSSILLTSLGNEKVSLNFTEATVVGEEKEEARSLQSLANLPPLAVDPLLQYPEHNQRHALGQASNNQFATVHMELQNTPNSSGGIYKLMIDDQSPMFVDEPAQIATAINDVAKDKGTSNVYLEVSTNRGDDSQALRMALIAQQKTLLPDLIIRTIARGHVEYLDSMFFLSGVHVSEKSKSAITKVSSGEHAGSFTTSFAVIVYNGIQGTLHFYSTSIKVLEAFIEACYALIDVKDLTRTSVAEIVNQARNEIKTTLHVDDNAVILEIEDQMGHVQVVTISQLSPTTS